MKILKFSASVLLLSSIIFTSGPLSPLLANKVQKILVIADKGSQSRPTTISKAELTIQIQAETSEEVQTAIANQSSSLVDYLRSQGVDKPQTQGLQIKPNQDNQGRTESYTGNNTISFQYAGDYSQVEANVGQSYRRDQSQSR